VQLRIALVHPTWSTVLLATNEALEVRELRAYHLPLTTHCSLLTAYHLLLTAHCSLLTTYCSLLTAHCSYYALLTTC
jgi:hypothetical protein